MKKSAKVPHKSSFASVLETPNRPTNIKCMISAFFRDWFVEKDGGWYTTNPSTKDLGGLEVFLVLSRSEV
jgi:hypothetical protein